MAAPVQGEARRLAPQTTRLYTRDWAEFLHWCRSQHVSALPADPAQVACYLAGFAGTLGRGALDRRRAAIAHEHRRAGLAVPATDPATRKLLRASGDPPQRRRTPPPSLAQLPRILGACPGDLAGLRDRALLLLLIVGRLPRAGLVGLEAEAVRFTDTGATLIPGAARHVADDGARTLSLPRNPDRLLCPVLALQDWLRASDTRFGPVFRKIDRWGNLEHRPLGTDAIRLILHRRTARLRRMGPAAVP